MSKTRAFIGDIHGCYEEFQILLDRLKWMPIDEIWLCGDLVDRGPDSGKVVQIAIDNKIPSVMGNHEDVIIRLWDGYQKSGELPKKSDKARTLQSLTTEHVEYMRALPKLHVFDDSNLILVHGGLWPSIPLYAQPINVIRAQMIKPGLEGESRWWGPEAQAHKSKKTEAESYAEGFRRWYEIYDNIEDVVYGHSVYSQPNIHRNKGSGRTIGIDTGNVFGGVLTAVVIGPGELFFVTVPPKKVYCEDKLAQFGVR